MPQISDPVTIRHPELPDVTTTISRRALPAHERRGWVEVGRGKSRAQQVSTSSVDESPTGDEPQPPSKEDLES